MKLSSVRAILENQVKNEPTEPQEYYLPAGVVHLLLTAADFSVLATRIP
jgi:hypothetical protein